MRARTKNGGEYEVGCFGCVFWVAIFVIFCILMFAAVDAVWNWAF